ncbi:hypothetical protein SRHO_G00222220 [Serrasalmus rhombeus]
MDEKQGVMGLREDQLNSQLIAKLLAWHGQRRTCGAEETEELVRQLLEAFCYVKDPMGIPLLDNERMVVIWNTQQQHHCIQDPPGLQLYAKRGQLTKYCLQHCIPCFTGTSANAGNFQAYLLEGLARWNENRAAAVVDQAEQALRCCSGHLQHNLNQLSQQLLDISWMRTTRSLASTQKSLH